MAWLAICPLRWPWRILPDVGTAGQSPHGSTHGMGWAGPTQTGLAARRQEQHRGCLGGLGGAHAGGSGGCGCRAALTPERPFFKPCTRLSKPQSHGKGHGTRFPASGTSGGLDGCCPPLDPPAPACSVTRSRTQATWAMPLAVTAVGHAVTPHCHDARVIPQVCPSCRVRPEQVTSETVQPNMQDPEPPGHILQLVWTRGVCDRAAGRLQRPSYCWGSPIAAPVARCRAVTCPCHAVRLLQQGGPHRENLRHGACSMFGKVPPHH